MYIRAGQIRAARGMLDWSREELAQETGLSANTIRNLETGALSPRENTTERIRQAFEGAGIYFTDDEGVRRERTDIKIIKGADSCEIFFDTVLHTVKRKQGEIIGIFNSRETITKSLGITKENRFDRLKDLGLFASIKCIFPDVNRSDLPTPYCEERVAPKYCVGPASYFVYGNRYALVQAIGNDEFRFVVFNDIDLALGYREHFYVLWNIATPLLMPSDVREKICVRA